MLLHKNSLSFSKACFSRLLNYNLLSDEDFIKTVKAILETHYLEFGLNKTYTDFLVKYKNKELDNKDKLIEDITVFIDVLIKKDEA